MSERRRALAWLSLFVVYVVWGSTYLAIRVVVKEMPPLAAAAVRFLVAGSAMGALAVVTGRGRQRPTAAQWRGYALAGVLLLAAGNAGVMWAETRVPSGIAALLVATVPLWVTFLDGLRRGGEPWTRRVWAGVVLGFLGVALVARPEQSGGDWRGVGVLQMSALAWTLGTLHAKSIAPKLPAFAATAIEMLAGAAAIVVESRLMGEDVSRLWRASPVAWAALGYLVVFGSIVAFTAFTYSLDALPASTVGTYAYVNPVVALGLGHVALGEPLAPMTLLGASVIVAAVVITTHRRRAEPACPDA